MSATKRAMRNSVILAAVVAAIAIYQGETLITSALSFAFSAIIFFTALLLSYRFSAKISGQATDSTTSAKTTHVDKESK